MNAFVYDRTFDGLLTVLFEAYRLRAFPDALLGPDDSPPLLAERIVEVVTDLEKSGRVWAGLEKKLSFIGLKQLMYAWLTEETAGAELILRYARAIFSGVAETDFSHPDILGMRQRAFKISREKEHTLQFVRFQKTADGIFFAGISPQYNVVPLVLDHFHDRFSDQRWVIYDLVRRYGFYYDLESLREIDFFKPVDEDTGRLADEDLDEDELLLQEAWRAYFNSVSIAERANPRLQRQFMPKRFWPFLTEMRPLEGISL